MFEIIFIYIKVGSVGWIIDFGYKWSVYCEKNFKFINNFVCLFLIIYSSYILIYVVDYLNLKGIIFVNICIFFKFFGCYFINLFL